MRGSSRYVMAGALGLLGGWLAGHHLLRDAEVKAEAPRAEGVEKRKGATPRQTAVADGRHDFQTLLREVRGTLSTSPIGQELERMSSGRLMSLLSELSLRENYYDFEAGSLTKTYSEIARELVRRKGMGAVEDAEAEPDPGRREQMKLALAIAAAKVSPAAAQAWMMREQEKRGKSGLRISDSVAIRGATLQGAAEFLDLYQKHGESWKGHAYPSSDFPEGFDFALLVRNLPQDTNPGMKRAQASWAARDKEAAMAAMRENISQHGAGAAANFGAVMTGVAIAEGNEKAAEWMATQLDTLPEDARKEALLSFHEQKPDIESVRLHENTVMEIAAKLPRESDRVEFVAGHFTRANAGYESNVAILRSLGSASEQEKVLVQVMPESRSSGYERLRDGIERYATELNLSEAARGRLVAEAERLLAK